MKKVEIYTDGSSLGNPGKGGWAAILLYGKHRRIISGHKAYATNNQMELTAVIEALKTLKEPCNLVIYSDSQYVVSAFNNNWLDKWIRNNWKTKKGPVANKDLWLQLIDQTQQGHMITWSKVRGHASNDLNNECDKYAKQAAERQKSVNIRY